MSRHEYSEDLDQRDLAMWRGQVASAIRGKRGQALLREMAAAMDAMPVKELIAGEFQTASGEVCALGAVAAARGVDVSALDPEDYSAVARCFGIAEALAREIMFVNDEYGVVGSAEKRWQRVRRWVADQLDKG